jgi:hypothetical protein
MMDIEKMKRVNALARELKDHGIVSDYDEAYKQAEKMIESGMETPPANEEISIKPYSEAKQNTGGLGMGFDALEIKNMKDKIDAMEQQMSMIFMKMNEIISEINRLDKRRMDSPIEVRDPKEVEEKQREMQTSLKKQEVEPHPRSGDYKPGDVAIEKMFYFGGSR